MTMISVQSFSLIKKLDKYMSAVHANDECLVDIHSLDSLLIIHFAVRSPTSLVEIGPLALLKKKLKFCKFVIIAP